MTRRDFVLSLALAPRALAGDSFEVSIRYARGYWQVWWSNDDGTITIVAAQGLADAVDMVRRHCESRFA